MPSFLHTILVGLAGASTLLFALKMLLMWVGADDALGGDGDEGIDASFKLLSTLGLTAFGMGLGWLALALMQQTNISSALALSLGALNGLLLMWLTALLLRSLGRLNSPTRHNRPQVGQRGRVLTRLGVPGGPPGLVRLIDEQTQQVREAPAMVAGNLELTSGTEVEVVAVDGTRVSVRAIESHFATQRKLS